MRYVIAGLLAAAVYYGVMPARQAHRARASQQGDRWTWNGRVARGKTVEIRDINGSVSAQPASGETVEVTAVKHAGRRGDPDDVRIEAAEHDGGVTICVLYPGRRRTSSCESGRRRGDSNDDNDTEVDFTVRVPRGVAFSGNTVNGEVEATGLDGPVGARSVNGGVQIETSGGEAEGESVNGAVRAVVRGQGHEPLRFSSVNGAVDVTLPRDLDADLEASTLNGSITTDFEVTVSGGMTMRRQRLAGRIGRGGRLLRVETLNGSIHLRAGT